MSLILHLLPTYNSGTLSKDEALLLGQALYDLNFLILARKVLAGVGDTTIVPKIDDFLQLLPQKSLDAWARCRRAAGDRHLRSAKARFEVERALLLAQTRPDWVESATPVFLRLLEDEQIRWEGRVQQTRLDRMSASGCRIDAGP